MNERAGERHELTLDARNRIASMSGALWAEFMRRDAVVEPAPTPVGRVLWEFVRGVQVRQLWEILFERVRAVGAPIFVPMRADTPDQRRIWDTELHPLPERGLQLISHCVWQESRPAVALLDPAFPRDDRSLARCAWCNRIQIRIGAWEEIEDAQFTLRIDTAQPLPSLCHAVCNCCKQSLLKTFPARVA